MKHLTIFCLSVMAYCMSQLVLAVANDAKVNDDTQVTAAKSDNDVVLAEQTEQVLKTVPLKPVTDQVVETGAISPVESETTPDKVATAAQDDAVNELKSEAEKQPDIYTPTTPVAAVDINPEDTASISLDEVNANSAIPTDRIRAVISNQEKAWNSGDIDAYMQGYWKSDKLRFVSNGKYNYGWDSILSSYKRSYPTQERMGKLSFNVREIKMLSNYAALVVGRWTLERAKDKPSGVFTLLIERIDDKWVITHDHSSD